MGFPTPNFEDFHYYEEYRRFIENGSPSHVPGHAEKLDRFREDYGPDWRAVFAGRYAAALVVRERWQGKTWADDTAWTAESRIPDQDQTLSEAAA